MTFDRVKNIIIEELGVSDEDNITLETSLADDLDADSLDAVEIIMALEDEFDISIPDEDAEGFKNIGDIIKYVESKNS
ncbi:MAG TPA: acyl carrier protein [Syntrophomonadaceae bacterium]|nr:acyl carrier protein [Syntrophomonadaceae bacterium]